MNKEQLEKEYENSVFSQLIKVCAEQPESFVKQCSECSKYIDECPQCHTTKS